jgi:hypothetical protein
VLGFEFHERMTGSLRILGKAKEAPMSLSILARSRRLGALRRAELEIEGEVDAEGFADHRLLRGAIDAGAIFRRRIPYMFEFTGNDGAAYAFSGEKTLTPGALIASFSILPGEICDRRGALVGKALLRFDMRTDALRCFKSFRTAL